MYHYLKNKKERISQCVSNMSILSTILSIIAIVISLISLAITTIFNMKQFQYNKKTLTPNLYINPGDYEDDIFIDIKNVGLGPLFIKEINIYRNDKLCDEKDLYKLIDTHGQPWSTFSGNIEGIAIPANEKIRIIEILPKNDIVKTSLRNQLKDIKIKIKYTDVYKSEYSYTKTLDFYGRHFA